MSTVEKRSGYVYFEKQVQALNRNWGRLDRHAFTSENADTVGSDYKELYTRFLNIMKWPCPNKLYMM